MGDQEVGRKACLIRNIASSWQESLGSIEKVIVHLIGFLLYFQCRHRFDRYSWRIAINRHRPGTPCIYHQEKYHPLAGKLQFNRKGNLWIIECLEIGEHEKANFVVKDPKSVRP